MLVIQFPVKFCYPIGLRQQRSLKCVIDDATYEQIKNAIDEHDHRIMESGLMSPLFSGIRDTEQKSVTIVIPYKLSYNWKMPFLQGGLVLKCKLKLDCFDGCDELPMAKLIFKAFG